MSTNGSGPLRPARGLHVRRPVALAIGIVAALLVAGLLVAPVVILSGGSKAKPCAADLLYQGRHYDARPVPRVVQAVAVGAGTESGGGGRPQTRAGRSVTARPRAVARTGAAGSVPERGARRPRAAAACSSLPHSWRRRAW